jgi:hypothetical protein
MQSKRPSPALVVATIALIVSLGGTAVAAKFLIVSTSQVKNGALIGADLRPGSITKNRLSPGVQGLLKGGAAGGGAGTSALEAHRLKGPDVANGGKAEVLSLDLAPGTYAVFAKATVEPFINDRGLLDTIFKDPKTVGGACTLDVGGTGDYAIQPVISPGSANPSTLNLQLTRTLSTPTKAVLTCQVDGIHWAGRDASIIALQVAHTERSES